MKATSPMLKSGKMQEENHGTYFFHRQAMEVVFCTNRNLIRMEPFLSVKLGDFQNSELSTSSTRWLSISPYRGHTDGKRKMQWINRRS